MIEYLSQYVDRGFIFFVVLFTTATATYLLTRALHDREQRRGVYEEDDPDSRNR